jgi:hypothetical protein
MQRDLRLLKQWQEYTKEIESSTPVNLNESALEKRKRMEALEADPERWFNYYFPAFAYAKPQPFHMAATLRIVANPEWYEVRAWSRELAKTTRTMFEVFYLSFVGHPTAEGTRHRKRNIILTSNSEDNAERLLLPYKTHMEKNQRLIYDYGELVDIGNWEAAEFVTKNGIAFRGIGAGQSPRGSRNQEIRPDILLIDDLDTDQDCRNPEIINKRWKWIEEALMPTRSISKTTTVIFCGNIIAKDCCIVRAIKVADHSDIINIRMPDENGVLRSSWPDKNCEEDIDRVLSKISYSSAQKEYFNNPITEGVIFKQLQWGEIRPLNEYKMLVCYTDPSYKESGDFKSTVLVGAWDDQFHIIKARCAQTTVSNMVDWHYEIMDLVGDNPCYYYMEEVFLQDMFYNDFNAEAITRGRSVPICGDPRNKPNKFMRIEGLLDPLNRRGKLLFNAAEKNDPGMQALQDQFLAFGPGSSAHDDGPDSVEGAIWILNTKMAAISSGLIEIIRRRPNASPNHF